MPCSGAADASRRGDGANACPRPFNSLAVGLPAAWNKVEGKEDLTFERMRVDVHLGDDKAKHLEYDGDADEGREFLQAFEKMKPPLAYNVVGNNLAQSRILVPKDGRKDIVHVGEAEGERLALNNSQQCR